MRKEAKARILLNNLLGRSGRRFFDDDTGPANIALEANVKLKSKALDALGDDWLLNAVVVEARTEITTALLADVRALDQWREVIPEYVKDYVSLNAFAA